MKIVKIAFIFSETLEIPLKNIIKVQMYVNRILQLQSKRIKKKKRVNMNTTSTDKFYAVISNTYHARMQ